MLLLIFLIQILPTAEDVKQLKVVEGIATVFGHPNDYYSGGTTRCLYDENGRKRAVRPDDVGVAHRELDCGAVVYVTNLETGKSVRAVVVDAGPWGAISTRPSTGNKFWYVKKHKYHRPGPTKCPSRRCKVGRWRGIVDLTPRAAALIDHDGWARVRIVYDKRDLRWYKKLQQAKQRRADRVNRS